MFIKKVFLITVIINIFSSCCIANNESYNPQDNDVYILAGANFSDRKDLVMIMLDSIRTSDDNPQIKYWWNVVVNKNKKLPYDTEKYMNKGNCLERKITILSVFQSLKNKLVYQFDQPFELYCPPNSVGDYQLKIVCSSSKTEIIKKEFEKNIMFLPKDPDLFLNLCQEIIERGVKAKKNNFIPTQSH